MASIMAINQPDVCTDWMGRVYGPSGEYVATCGRVRRVRLGKTCAQTRPDVCTDWIGRVYGPSGEYVATCYRDTMRVRRGSQPG